MVCGSGLTFVLSRWRQREVPALSADFAAEGCGDAAADVHHPGEGRQVERLRGVAACRLRVGMHLHNEAVGPRRHARRRHALHEARVARAVAGIDDHGQVSLVKPGHRRQRERKVCVRLEGADAALAEHHLAVARIEDIFRGQQQFLDRRRRPALEEHRQGRAPHRLEQPVVLHVARAHLENVGVTRHERHVLVHENTNNMPRPVH